MASNITLSAGVRQNLLSLQETSSLIATVQNRLATGKAVNSALDNPGSFFTSQSLQNRASDLNGLLDAIGQAQQTLKAADQGITAIGKLVESAKSVAKQAQQASLGSQTVYNAFSVSGTAGAETLGTVTGAGLGATLGVGNGGNLVITANGTDYTVALADGDDISTIVSKVNAVTGAGGANVVTASDNGSGQLKLDAVTADVDFSIKASTDDVTSTALGLTEGTAHNSTSLLDNLVSNGGSTGDTLTVAVNGGANQVITFGTGAGQISTLAELNSTLQGVSGLAAGSGVSGVTLTFNVASTSSQNSVNLTSSSAAVTTTLGLAGKTGTTQGTVTVSGADPTRASLEADFNEIIAQIDTLAADAGFNGINLLNGDDLKVSFNENGASALTISGVTYNASGLGLAAVGAGTFQSNGNIDTQIGKLDVALTSLRTQASKFGASLTTVETRQDFTKNLITTLQTGADSLVLADTNLEGANLLALQTRQSLSSTALSLSAQADRAVLRLFS